MEYEESMDRVFNWLEERKLTAHAREYWDTHMDSPNPQINDTLSLISSADSIWETNETIIQTQITKDEWDQIRHDNTGDFEEDIKKDKVKWEVHCNAVEGKYGEHLKPWIDKMQASAKKK